MDDKLKYLSGGFAGASGILVSYPFDTIKTYHQVKNTNNIKEAFNIIKNTYGIQFINKGLYRGVSLPLIGMFFEKAIVFGVQNDVKKLKLFNGYYNDFFSGFISGLSCGIVVTPIEKFKILMQSNLSFKDVFNKSFKNNNNIYMNFTNLYRGYSSTIIREGFGFGSYFVIYNLLKNNHKKNTNIEFNPFFGMIYGASSGFGAWALMFPSDQIKTIQQYYNFKFFHSIRYIYYNYGFKGFYKGYIPALVRASILHAGVFGGYEFFNKIMKYKN